MQILVTGGAGFLGSALVRRLIDLGHSVRVVDDLSAGDPDRVPAEASFSRGDVNDLPRLWTLLQGVECVYHLAARVSVQESMRYPREYNAVNVGGTVSVLEAMGKAPDPLAAARGTAVLNSHLRIHLDKEDIHLYPILRERISESEQVSIVGLMSKKVPPEKFPTLIQWLFPLLGLEDQVVVTKGWMTLMPPQVFAGVKPLIKKSVAGNWSELARRIPDLSDQ